MRVQRRVFHESEFCVFHEMVSASVPESEDALIAFTTFYPHPPNELINTHEETSDDTYHKDLDLMLRAPCNFLDYDRFVRILRLDHYMIYFRAMTAPVDSMLTTRTITYSDNTFHFCDETDITCANNKPTNKVIVKVNFHITPLHHSVHVEDECLRGFNHKIIKIKYSLKIPPGNNVAT